MQEICEIEALASADRQELHRPDGCAAILAADRASPSPSPLWIGKESGRGETFLATEATLSLSRRRGRGSPNHLKRQERTQIVTEVQYMSFPSPVPRTLLYVGYHTREMSDVFGVR